MNAPNINQETGIRYGLISAHSLDPEIIDEIQSSGFDVRLEEARAEVRAAVREVCRDYMGKNAADRVAEHASEELTQDFENDEPVHTFERKCEGGHIVGRTSWLGGALHVWVFNSPYTGIFRQCSPCAPNACDLDSPVDVLRDNVGALGYDVPPDWRDAR